MLKGISAAVLAGGLTTGYFIRGINNAELQAIRNLTRAYEYLQEKNYFEALEKARQCYQIRFLPESLKKGADLLIEQIEREKIKKQEKKTGEKEENSLEKKLRENEKIEESNFQELVSLEKRIETELEDKVAEAKEEAGNGKKEIEKEEKNFRINNIANVNVTFGFINEELYWEYKRKIPEIPFSNYLNLVNTGKPIKIPVNNEIIYLVSQKMIERFDLPLERIESERYTIVNATSKNKGIDNEKVVSVYLREYQKEIWRRIYINALIFAEENGANIISINDFVTTLYGTKREFSGEISSTFSTYELEEEDRKKDKEKEIEKRNKGILVVSNKYNQF